MKIYLSTTSVPELQAYPKNQHRLLIKQATKENMLNPLLWFGYGILILSLLIVMPAASIFMVFYMQLVFPLSFLISILIGGTIGFVSVQILYAVLRPTLARYRYELEQDAAEHKNEYLVPHA